MRDRTPVQAGKEKFVYTREKITNICAAKKLECLALTRKTIRSNKEQNNCDLQAAQVIQSLGARACLFTYN